LDNHRLAAFKDGYTGIGGAQVNTNNFAHYIGSFAL
jgi:hypothetical protein